MTLLYPRGTHWEWAKYKRSNCLLTEVKKTLDFANALNGSQEHSPQENFAAVIGTWPPRLSLPCLHLQHHFLAWIRWLSEFWSIPDFLVLHQFCFVLQLICCIHVDLLCSHFLFAPTPCVFNPSVRFLNEPISQYHCHSNIEWLWTLPTVLTFTLELTIHKYPHFNFHSSRKPKHPEGKYRYKGKPCMPAVWWTHIRGLCLRHFICHFNLLSKGVIGLFHRANCLIVWGHLDFYMTWLSSWIARLWLIWTQISSGQLSTSSVCKNHQ